mmetsp:Transcript_17777/g.44802  ORF Transcript_17777/g.44802 Transcript_17777/m.44802 type:complete len:208 (-) Transcript_17777:1645-2268(-)
MLQRMASGVAEQVGDPKLNGGAARGYEYEKYAGLVVEVCSANVWICCLELFCTHDSSCAVDDEVHGIRDNHEANVRVQSERFPLLLHQRIKDALLGKSLDLVLDHELKGAAEALSLPCLAVELRVLDPETVNLLQVDQPERRRLAVLPNIYSKVRPRNVSIHRHISKPHSKGERGERQVVKCSYARSSPVAHEPVESVHSGVHDRNM